MEKYKHLKESTEESKLVTIKIMMYQEERKATVCPQTSWGRDILTQWFASELEEGKSVRLICNGRLVSETDQLDKFSLDEGSVVHAVVNEKKEASETPAD
jgi:hypothetical protein